VALALLVRGAMKKKTHSGCGCPANEVKTKIGKR
jgi:hypothetical protein